jgi:homoserine kinase type II
MAVYTPLTQLELAQVTRAYGLPAPDRAVAEPKGSVNTNYHLWAGGRRWFLRVNEGKTDAEVAFEAKVLRHLEASRFPAVRLVPAAEDGPSHVTVAGKQAMLFAFVPGEELERHEVTAARCRAVGDAMGRLHDLARSFDGERRNPYGPARVASWVAELEPDGGGDPEVGAALPMIRDELARSAALPAAPAGLVHGDLFLDNVLWVGDELSALLDWEMSCTDAFAYDLAVAVNAWCYGVQYEPGLARAFLDGYRGRARLARETADALYAYARYVALRYTVSRIHAFHRAELGADRLAWKDWTRYRDRLAALRRMDEAGFRALLGA